MKITSLMSSGVLEFNDLGSYIKGVSPVIRDIRLNPGQSIYLLETSEVLLSAQSGDIARYAKAPAKISVNDTVVLANAAGVTLTHNFGILPNVTVIKGAGVAPVACVIGVDITIAHNAAYTTTTVTNISGGQLTFGIRIG
jgi:hypothetical protein